MQSYSNNTSKNKQQKKTLRMATVQGYYNDDFGTASACFYTKKTKPKLWMKI